jgi:Domain of unknown function (DUF4168)
MRILAMMNKLLPVIFGIALICGSSLAFAQGNSNTQVSDQELTAFAKAYTEVQRIRSQYEPSLQRTKDARESQRLQREANARLKKTLDKQGLSIDRYNKIYTAVNANEALRRKALRLVERERKQS